MEGLVKGIRKEVDGIYKVVSEVVKDLNLF